MYHHLDDSMNLSTNNTIGDYDVQSIIHMENYETTPFLILLQVIDSLDSEIIFLTIIGVSIRQITMEG